MEQAVSGRYRSTRGTQWEKERAGRHARIPIDQRVPKEQALGCLPALGGTVGMMSTSKCDLPIVGRRRVLQTSALVGVASLAPSVAANSQIDSKVAAMAGEITPDEIRRLRKLE